MNKIQTLSFAAFGVSLIVVGILVKSHPLLDSLANISFPYLAGMLGLAVLVVGIHCLLFASPIRELPLLPNVVLFAIIAGASNVNIVWDGVLGSYTKDDIWLNLSNSLEFTIYYAAFLFLPRYGPSARTDATRSSDAGGDDPGRCGA